MRTEKCGVCNHEIPMEQTRMMRKEKDGSFTFYHMRCETRAGMMDAPCPDCGEHRYLCDECAEPKGGQS